MKKIIIFMFLIPIFSLADEFCKGYEDGYQEGVCDGVQFCMKPLPPLCPLPNLGESTFRDGYNRGFKDGLRKKRGSTF